MIARGRLYRDSEMPVNRRGGVGPRRLLKPVLMVVVPVVALVARARCGCPWAERQAKQMINEANRNLIVAGSSPARSPEIRRGGVIYVGSMSADGSQFQRVFVYRHNDDRLASPPRPAARSTSTTRRSAT